MSNLRQDILTIVKRYWGSQFRPNTMVVCKNRKNYISFYLKNEYGYKITSNSGSEVRTYRYTTMNKNIATYVIRENDI